MALNSAINVIADSNIELYFHTDLRAGLQSGVLP